MTWRKHIGAHAAVKDILQWLDSLGITEVRGSNRRVLVVNVDTACKIILSHKYQRSRDVSDHKTMKRRVDFAWYQWLVLKMLEGAKFDIEHGTPEADEALRWIQEDAEAWLRTVGYRDAGYVVEKALEFLEVRQ